MNTDDIQYVCELADGKSIFVSGKCGAENIDEISKYNIQHIISIRAADAKEPRYTQFLGIDYFEITAFRDGAGSDLDIYILTVREYIRSCVPPNKNVLIHCVAGTSRSPAICCGLLIQENLTYNQAMQILKAVRPTIDIHPHFKNVLELKKIKEKGGAYMSDRVNTILFTTLEPGETLVSYFKTMVSKTGCEMGREELANIMRIMVGRKDFPTKPDVYTSYFKVGDTVYVIYQNEMGPRNNLYALASAEGLAYQHVTWRGKTMADIFFASLFELPDKRYYLYKAERVE